MQPICDSINHAQVERFIRSRETHNNLKDIFMADAIRERKRLAMGQSIDFNETFGVDPIESRPHPDSGSIAHRKTNRDKDRAASTPIDRDDGHGAQANPYHGPH